ncbi:MAG: hypothetical protein ACFBWO_09485, partial [Paracoccaceae bacterium]
MALFVVDTGQDVVEANDGRLSLREAVAAAESAAGADTIVFAEGLESVRIDAPLALSGAQRLTIDGDRDDDGLFDVTIDGRGRTKHFEIEDRAVVELDGLSLVGGFDAGERAVGSIDNAGNLTLVRTLIDRSVAVGLDGAQGEPGVDGAAGGRGRDGSLRTGRNGEDGGVGGDGGEGGVGETGALAVGGVLNDSRGSLVLIDSAVGAAVDGLPGDGGQGGTGGRGGQGGDGGRGAGGVGSSA